MTIPIKNLYYLLCYAWDALEQKDAIPVDREDFKHLSDLFAKVLIEGTTHLLKHGLDQGYTVHEEDTRRLRGRILFQPSLSRLLLQQSRAICSFDELTHNVLHNQILKTTILRLTRTEGLDTDLRQGLDLLARRFPCVDTLTLQTGHFRCVRLTRSSRGYRFLMSICRIIHDHWLTCRGDSPLLFADFVRDDERMRLLFQSFVWKFYERELPEYDAKPEQFEWHRASPSTDDRYLPVMRTDVSLTHRKRARKIVIETKFKQDEFQRYYGTEKLHSAHLYQLYAYLKNLESAGGINQTAEGVLLYAATDGHKSLRFELPGHTVRMVALNLAQDWRDIERDLHALVAQRDDRPGRLSHNQ